MTSGPRGPHQGCYYNDSDPFVCAWLKNLISAGLIPAGDVDGRPIQEVQPDEVRAYSQAHFFAGIGGWAYALRLAGWPDERPIWTGSCPCPSFSYAGRGRGLTDVRHLWPEWRRLIVECGPPVVFGEQVAGAVGFGWWDLVAAELEVAGYAVAATVLGAHSVGAPHKRQRLWFVADAERGRQQEPRLSVRPEGQEQAASLAGRPREADKRRAASMAAAPLDGRDARRARHAPEVTERGQPDRGGEPRAVQHAPVERPESGRGDEQSEARPAGWDLGQWAVEPDVGRVAHGIPNRVGSLCGFGNAIVPQVAAAFVSAYLECQP